MTNKGKLHKLHTQPAIVHLAYCTPGPTLAGYKNHKKFPSIIDVLTHHFSTTLIVCHKLVARKNPGRKLFSDVISTNCGCGS